MSVLFVVLPLAVLFSALAVAAFLWSTHHGQLDDLDTPPLRALRDDTPANSRDSHPPMVSSATLS
jgi:cbb3-type cytochrome oxidase maturation protein